MSNSDTLNFHPDGTLFIVSGPSGAGKTTLIDNAREDLGRIGLGLYFSVSHTTRPPREGEKEGREYYFVSPAEFKQMAERGEFIEYANVHGNLYGTSRKEILTQLERGRDVILDIDVQGARQIAGIPELKNRSVMVFVFPPSFQEMEKRIRARKQNSEEEILVRLNKNAEEIEVIEQGFKLYDYVVINDKVEVATECLKAAIVAKKIRTNAALEALQAMARQFKEERIGRTTQGR